MIYLILALIVLAINVAPVLMPATWTLLAFFIIKYDLALLPTIILGAMAATIGRMILANGARRYVRPFLSEKSKINLEALGKFLVGNKKLSIPLLVGYAFLPIPSNQVFIALGLSGLNFDLVAGSFFAGRLISYTFWVKMADKLADNYQGVISSGWTNPKSLITEGIGLVCVLLILVIPWGRILRVKVKE